MSIPSGDSATDLVETLSRSGAIFGEIKYRVLFDLSDGCRVAVKPGHNGFYVDDGDIYDASVKISSEDLISLMNNNITIDMLILLQKLVMSGNKLYARYVLSSLRGEIYVQPPPVRHVGIPAVTMDIDRARSDLGDWGYCLIGEALDEEMVRIIRDDLDAEAAYDVEMGCASFEGGSGDDPEADDAPNQRLNYLVNRSENIRNLVIHPIVEEILEPILGESYICSLIKSIITGPGGKPQVMHYDQSFIPQRLSFSAFYNVVWFIDDVTEENGGTRVIPGSHLWDTGPVDPTDISDSVAAAGSAGTLMIFDGRLWHGTGPNTTPNKKRRVIFTSMSYYYLRSQDNYFLLLDEEVEESLCPKLKTRFGYRTTGALGAVGPVVDGWFVGRNQPRYSKRKILEKIKNGQNIG